MPEYYFEGNPGQTYTGPLTSAQYNAIINGGSDVQDVSGSNIQGVYGRVNQLADWLAEYSQQATNFNAREAATLRSWQEEQNRKAMDFSAQQAASNRQWQEYMSNTAHQREVADLKAAGLNPILSVNGGAGASTPSGSYAQGVSSAGAKAEFDTSASGSLVNLLGSMLSSMTQIADTATNAQANLAYADIMGEASKMVAGINAGATLGSAGMYSNAYIYGYDLGFQEAVDKIESTESENAKDRAHEIDKIVLGHENDMAKLSSEQEHDKYMAYNYPTTATQAAYASAKTAADLSENEDNLFSSLIRALTVPTSKINVVYDPLSHSYVPDRGLKREPVEYGRKAGKSGRSF